MNGAPVRPFRDRLTDMDARHLLASGLLRVCHTEGPSRVALEIGCDEKTVRRARDEQSTLQLHSAINLAARYPGTLDALFADVGLKLVPLQVRCAGDPIVSQSAAITKIAEARSQGSQGGATETDEELLAMEACVDAALESLHSLKDRIALAKRRRAA